MSTEKQYANRDPEAQGMHYITHVGAMTSEGLHSKSSIAAELAHRDIEISRLHAENEALRTGYDAARLEVESLKKALAEHIETRIPSNHAGVIMWVGDYRVERHLSEVEVRNWRLPSDVLFLLANSCRSTLVQRLNQQTQDQK